MTITTKTVEPGIVSVTVDYPPVNAIPSKGWWWAPSTCPAGSHSAPCAASASAGRRQFPIPRACAGTR